jgi:hypothetical protein
MTISFSKSIVIGRYDNTPRGPLKFEVERGRSQIAPGLHYRK